MKVDSSETVLLTLHSNRVYTYAKLVWPIFMAFYAKMTSVVMAELIVHGIGNMRE